MKQLFQRSKMMVVFDMFSIHVSAGIPIIFMTSLIFASLSSTKLFMMRVRGQMKTKTLFLGDLLAKAMIEKNNKKSVVYVFS